MVNIRIHKKEMKKDPKKGGCQANKFAWHLL